MIRARYFSVAALIVTLAVVAAGCHKKIPQVAAAPAPPPAPPTVPTTPPPPPAPSLSPSSVPPSSAALSEEELFQRKTLDQLNAERPLSDVFFDLDQSTVRDEARAVLQKDADWLKKWTTTRIVLEGHCDARGSSEYNLALGTRRATAVKEYLASLGVAPGRVTVVSKGKEQPFCSDENESCWQQNRRGHFVISGK